MKNVQYNQILVSTIEHFTVVVVFKFFILTVYIAETSYAVSDLINLFSN